MACELVNLQYSCFTNRATDVGLFQWFQHSYQYEDYMQGWHTPATVGQPPRASLLSAFLLQLPQGEYRGVARIFQTGGHTVSK